MTDCERLIKFMRDGGVVCPTDWNGPNPIDGGKPIMRIAARILDIKKLDHPVQRVGTRNRCATYAFVYEPTLFGSEAA